MLMRKPRSYAEVYNELDGEIVNVFRVVRDRGDELRRALELTPFAREEFLLSYEPSDDPLEQARRTITRSFMGFGSAAVCGQVSGFRGYSGSNRSTTPAQDWRNYPDSLPAVIDRLRGVVIEQRDATEVMRQHDGPETLHYVDPPYHHDTRNRGDRNSVKSYKHEMSDDQHRDLAAVLKDMQGMVILSGYRLQLYDDLYAKWNRLDRAAHADGARDRVESLWLSPNVHANQMRMTL